MLVDVMYGLPPEEEEVPSGWYPGLVQEWLRGAFRETNYHLGWTADRQKQYFDKPKPT